MNSRMRHGLVSVCLLQAILIAPLNADGQFLNIQIELEPDVSAVVERPLDFGSIPSDAGEVRIGLGDGSMGVFAIRAIDTQRLFLSIDAPDVLRHESLEATIPLDLELAFTDFGVDDYTQAVSVNGPFEEIVIQSPPDTPNLVWSFAYLYVYGWLEVANVPEGVYTGDVILNIEYE